MKGGDRYWDSDAFLGYLKGEPDKCSACEEVLSRAGKGEVTIVTSALTLTEVLFAKYHPKLPKIMREEIATFFDSDYIALSDVDITVAKLARDVVWDNNIKPKDAIHVATALLWGVPLLNTFDGRLLKHDGKINSPHPPHAPLRIRKPGEEPS